MRDRLENFNWKNSLISFILNKLGFTVWIHTLFQEPGLLSDELNRKPLPGKNQRQTSYSLLQNTFVFCSPDPFLQSFHYAQRQKRFCPYGHSPSLVPSQKLRDLAVQLALLCFCPYFTFLANLKQTTHQIKSLMISLNHRILHTCYVQGLSDRRTKELRI